MSHYIFVLNCGSSSLKFSVINPENGEEPLKGLAERLGVGGVGNITIKTAAGGKTEQQLDPGTHQEALHVIVAALKKEGLMDKIKAVGHRIVHGGEYFAESVLVDDDVRNKIVDCIRLAPLHNPAHVTGIDAAREAFPDLKQVVVFDTAFHQTMPPKAYMYALPYRYYSEMRIRRYGAHGTSHRYVTQRAGEFLNMKPEDHRFITCHIGNGASISAVDHGKCVDTSMGLTPLEGLMMGTRTGDIDASAILYIMEREHQTLEEAVNLLNKESGVLGITEMSSDMRIIDDAAMAGNERAQLALDMYDYRIKKYIGAYAAAMNGVDAIIFTAGVGEHQWDVREEACKNMEYLGVKLDFEKNRKNFGEEEIISTPDSKVIVAVIPTDEELLIAKDTEELVAKC